MLKEMVHNFTDLFNYFVGLKKIEGLEKNLKLKALYI